MKKKHIVIMVLLSLFVLNLRVVVQPEYDHYVIGIRYPNACLVFSAARINCIVVGEHMYVKLSEAELMSSL